MTGKNKPVPPYDCKGGHLAKYKGTKRIQHGRHLRHVCLILNRLFDRQFGASDVDMNHLPTFVESLSDMRSFLRQFYPYDLYEWTCIGIFEAGMNINGAMSEGNLGHAADIAAAFGAGVDVARTAYLRLLNLEQKDSQRADKYIDMIEPIAESAVRQKKKAAERMIKSKKSAMAAKADLAKPIHKKLVTKQGLTKEDADFETAALLRTNHAIICSPKSVERWRIVFKWYKPNFNRGRQTRVRGKRVSAPRGCR